MMVIGKSRRSGCQLVDVWCFHMRIACKTKVAIALVIGHDKDDVGLGRGLRFYRADEKSENAYTQENKLFCRRNSMSVFNYNTHFNKI